MKIHRAVRNNTNFACNISCKPQRSLVETYFIINGNISSSVQQRFYHRHVFVLGSPDDRRPAAAVLK